MAKGGQIYWYMQAYAALVNNKILSKLKKFNPILVGTIPINIHLENSDLDIICCFSDRLEFQKSLIENFKYENNFSIKEIQNLHPIPVVANFFVDNFEIEIFGQNIPIKQQLGYRHLIIENNLINLHGEKFRQQIIKLKQGGYKTEPAFAMLLGLIGDPYVELLKFEDDNE
ncbi:DUF4269 domain-containing protein [Pedobacter petrophilus]|uniref:DUF4269 domain-containing protein n=1 Tax=Pedobacter petrophilus TaxID=1908241 RepID=UPI0036285A46